MLTQTQEGKKKKKKYFHVLNVFFDLFPPVQPHSTEVLFGPSSLIKEAQTSP